MSQDGEEVSHDVTDSLKQLYEAIQDPLTFNKFPDRNGVRIEYHELLEHYSLDHLQDGARTQLEKIADGEDFRYTKTADLYIQLSINGNDHQEVKRMLHAMEDHDVQSQTIRQFKPFLKETIEEQLEEQSD